MLYAVITICDDLYISVYLKGGDFNIPDYSGLTPLHLASREGHVEAVEYLLKHGASVHKKDNFNCNPLYLAIKYKCVHCIHIVFIMAISLSLPFCLSLSLPLFFSLTRHFDVIKLLVKTGAQITESSTKIGILLCQ